TSGRGSGGGTPGGTWRPLRSTTTAPATFGTGRWTFAAAPAPRFPLRSTTTARARAARAKARPMAEVFPKVESGPFEGRKILRAVAGTEDVIEGIDHRAQRIAADARKVLRSTAGHDPHSPGYSNAPARISVEMASGP